MSGSFSRPNLPVFLLLAHFVSRVRAYDTGVLIVLLSKGKSHVDAKAGMEFVGEKMFRPQERAYGYCERLKR